MTLFSLFLGSLLTLFSDERMVGSIEHASPLEKTTGEARNFFRTSNARLRVSPSHTQLQRFLKFFWTTHTWVIRASLAARARWQEVANFLGRFDLFGTGSGGCVAGGGSISKRLTLPAYPGGGRADRNGAPPL